MQEMSIKKLILKLLGIPFEILVLELVPAIFESLLDEVVHV